MAYVVGVCFLALVAIGFTLLYVTPVPAALFLRSQFADSSATSLPGYDVDQVIVEDNITYPSSRSQNQLDLYLPADHDSTTPVILWVHGGAYVGGDKSGIEKYASCLAADGYAVVCMNYELAPEENYPGPLIQMAEVYAWITSESAEGIFDANSLVLAGDSAGAHLAAQFALIQTSTDYAAKVGLTQTVESSSLRATLLFCGPYDMSTLGSSDNTVVNYFLSRAGWAYFGERDWLERYEDQINITDNVTSSFPSTFITDGNTGSFEKDGKALASKLEDLGVSVSTYFTPTSEASTAHEYQFDMESSAGQQSYAEVLSFLKKTVG